MQETRLWDEEKQITRPMRSKEEAQDYRYFPEPDLPPLYISNEEIEKIKKLLPELPNVRKERFMVKYGLTEYDSNLLTSTKETADFFEECLNLKGFNPPKEVANWIIGPVTRYLNEHNITISETKLKPQHLVGIITYVHEGIINQNTAKNILPEILRTGIFPEDIIKEKGLSQVTDEKEISKAVDKVLEENQEVINDFKKGKTKAIGFLVGQIMKATKGKANPAIVNKLLNQKLKTTDNRP